MIYDAGSGRWDARASEFRARFDGAVHRAIEASRPHVRSAAGHVGGALQRAQAWTRERSVRSERGSDSARRAAEPVYILAAIALGIPALLLIPLVGMNPGIQEGTLTILVAFIVVSAFAAAAVYEIKRLADQSPDDKSH